MDALYGIPTQKRQGRMSEIIDLGHVDHGHNWLILPREAYHPSIPIKFDQGPLRSYRHDAKISTPSPDDIYYQNRTSYISSFILVKIIQTLYKIIRENYLYL